MNKLLTILLVLLSFSVTAKEQSFKIDGGTFDIEVYVFITNDPSTVLDTISSLLSEEQEIGTFDARGITLYNYGYPIVVWLPENSDQSIVNHELLHVVTAIMKWASVPFDDSTEEVYAYEIQYLSKQFNKFLSIY